MGFLVMDLLVSAAEGAQVFERFDQPECSTALLSAGAATGGALLASTREEQGEFARNRHRI